MCNSFSLGCFDSWDIFRINSNNGNFIALQMKSFGIKKVQRLSPLYYTIFFEALGMYLVSQNIFAIKEKSFYVPTSFILSLPKMLLYCNYRKPRNARRTEAQWQECAETAAEKYSKHSKFQLRLELLCRCTFCRKISNLYENRGTVTRACWECCWKIFQIFQISATTGAALSRHVPSQKIQIN